MKKTFYSALMLASFALCGTFQLGASEASLLDENFAAITRSAGPGGGGPGVDGPGGPGDKFIAGYVTGSIRIPDPSGEGYIIQTCCIDSVPTNACNYGAIGCISTNMN